jgi:hypothetical protein
MKTPMKWLAIAALCAQAGMPRAEAETPAPAPAPAPAGKPARARTALVRGAPEMVYRAGDTFFESADGVHELSANASAQAPAKFLAFFLCDRETPVSVPVPAATRSKQP